MNFIKKYLKNILIIFILGINSFSFSNNIEFNFNEPFRDYDLQYNLNDFFDIFSSFKIILLFKFYLKVSKYYNFRAKRINSIIGIKFTNIFVLKSELKDANTLFIFLILFILGLNFAIIINIFENNLNFNFFNCLWLCFVSVTTIGYGDYSPINITSKISLLIFWIFGYSIIGIYIINTLKIFDLNLPQNSSYKLTKIINKKEIINNELRSIFIKFLNKNTIHLKSYNKDINKLKNDNNLNNQSSILVNVYFMTKNLKEKFNVIINK